MKRLILILVLLIAVTSSYAQRGITSLKLIEAKKVTTDTLEYRGEKIDFADLKSRAKFVGNYDLSVGSFPTASHVGSMYKLSADGTVNDTLYRAGDILISIKENASISVLGENWILIDNSETQLSNRYEVEVTIAGTTTYPVPFKLSNNALVWFNGSLLGQEEWSGGGTASLTLLFTPYPYDIIKIQN
ncbi:MAG: hypothetical protein A2W90_18060 [Bacteroidetes bacterium GWF2_42_66]|nr:MAG: hypothetical protein A2W89_09550 [Bacteroidetes bacterium GWE2_42_39]OFY42542.1 MAG: hypothetical protein A2W90_18060 [Bacteroidetes bacterium GWF2_42_66]HBL74258.1 hypothetical protein [Prolixibacteraceae bacterium]HCU64027.1 hypothetical protein [Prolixibacteraceae bacterium]